MPLLLSIEIRKKYSVMWIDSKWNVINHYCNVIIHCATLFAKKTFVSDQYVYIKVKSYSNALDLRLSRIWESDKKLI